jgi:hypothetical protein
MDSGLYDWIYWHLIYSTRNYRQLQRYRYSHILQFTVTHALGSSVFTSPILATDVWQSHCHFKSHMKTSFHSLIHFLPFLLNHLRLPSPELDPILDNNEIKLPSLSLHNPLARTTQKTQPLYCWEGLFTDLLPNNGRTIFECVRFRGNVFTESLPSNVSISHNTILIISRLAEKNFPLSVFLICYTLKEINVFWTSVHDAQGRKLIILTAFVWLIHPTHTHIHATILISASGLRRILRALPCGRPYLVTPRAV